MVEETLEDLVQSLCNNHGIVNYYFSSKPLKTTPVLMPNPPRTCQDFKCPHAL